MSVSKMKRLTAYVPRDDLDLVIKRLLKQRCVQISSKEWEDACELERIGGDERKSELENRLAAITRAINVLDVYVMRKKGFFLQKASVDRDSFVADGRVEEAERIVDEVLYAEERYNKLMDERQKLRSAIAAATPYKEWDLPLNFSGTQTTEAFVGVLPGDTDLDACGRALYEAGAVANTFSGASGPEGIYASFFCHRSNSAAVAALLNSYGFVRGSFPGVEVTALEYMRECRGKIKAVSEEMERIKAKNAKRAEAVDMLETLYDIRATELVAVEQVQKLVGTAKTAIIDAWIPAGREGTVSACLDRCDCAYEICDPDGEDIPPVLLKNNGFASNFEWVLGMYSYPQYGRFDPTFIMSIFYLIIFGIMFADVGYGLILTLACFAVVKFMHPGLGVKRALTMFGYCGISCIVFGAIFGSYFGDLPLAIMKNMMGIQEGLPSLSLLGSSGPTLALIMDPLQNPMGFLVVALGMGAIHLVAGMAIRFYILCRDKKVLDAIFDIGSYWVLFAGLGMLFVIPEVGKWVAVAGVALIVLTHGRKEKNVIMKLAKGLLGLYDLINYASDLLSYSRILALGLSASIIGQVVNILGTMGGPTVGGFIMFVLIFIVGHLLNLAINVLGSFVHTARLQYIEFFSKFYEDGGVAFDPALPSERYTEDIR